MEVEVIRKESIKPSSPTPPHLNTYKISFLDQYAPPVYPPLILYYLSNQDDDQTQLSDAVSEKLKLLKKSLSETLTRFYPLAGKVKDHLTIDCNDDGAEFVEARANYNLTDFLSRPDISLLNNFLPVENRWANSAVGSPMLLVQATVFSCGGIILSICICHMVADASTIISFVKHWAAISSQNDKNLLIPNFDSPAMFPQNESHSTSTGGFLKNFFAKGKSITRRFLFEASAIAKLKDKPKSSEVEYFSRVEAVSALIWKHIVSALEITNGIHKPSVITQQVNFRSRTIPQLSESSMGNLYLSVPALCQAKETELHALVSIIRDATRKVEADLLKKLQGNEGFFKMIEIVKEMTAAFSNVAASENGANYIAFTSLCKFGCYSIDFGWGKPIWVTGGSSESSNVFFNYVELTDTKDGEGIEAWITVGEEVHDQLGNDREFLGFAKVDPSPLRFANTIGMSILK